MCVYIYIITKYIKKIFGCVRSQLRQVWIFSCDMRTLSCCMLDLVPQRGINPGSPALGAWTFSPWTTKEVPQRHSEYTCVVHELICKYIHAHFICMCKENNLEKYVTTFQLLEFQNSFSCCCCSYTKSCLTLGNPTDSSICGFPVLHYLPEVGQIKFLNFMKHF